MKKLNLALSIVFMTMAVQSQTTVNFYTSMGNFTVEIYDNIVPITGGNFLNLVDQEYYDGVIFHRVIDNFMIQGGNGATVSPIQDEFDSSLSNIQKTISMANAGPNTGSSQFFINLVNNRYLDFDTFPSSKHPVFGMVTANFNVVQAIGKVATNSSDKPLTDVVMDSVRRQGNPVGLEEKVKQDLQVWIYPNPINQSSTLNVRSENSSEADIKVFDAQGRKVSFQQVGLKQGLNELNISSLLKGDEAKGIYHISIVVDNRTQQINFLVP